MKKHTVVLEFEEEPSAFENMAFLLFHTPVPNYAFVDDLNHLYDLALSRTNDIELMGDLWPMFTYQDPLRQLTYHLIERPAHLSPLPAPHWGPAEKLLIVIGQGADAAADAIAGDFTRSHAPADPADLRAVSHAQRLEYYQQHLVAITLYDPLAQPTASKKTAKERAELETLLADIADSLDLAGE